MVRCRKKTYTKGPRHVCVSSPTGALSFVISIPCSLFCRHSCRHSCHCRCHCWMGGGTSSVCIHCNKISLVNKSTRKFKKTYIWPESRRQQRLSGPFLVFLVMVVTWQHGDVAGWWCASDVETRPLEPHPLSSPSPAHSFVVILVVVVLIVGWMVVVYTYIVIKYI